MVSSNASFQKSSTHDEAASETAPLGVDLPETFPYEDLFVDVSQPSLSACMQTTIESTDSHLLGRQFPPFSDISSLQAFSAGVMTLGRDGYFFSSQCTAPLIIDVSTPFVSLELRVVQELDRLTQFPNSSSQFRLYTQSQTSLVAPPNVPNVPVKLLARRCPDTVPFNVLCALRYLCESINPTVLVLMNTYGKPDDVLTVCQEKGLDITHFITPISITDSASSYHSTPMTGGIWIGRRKRILRVHHSAPEREATYIKYIPVQPGSVLARAQQLQTQGNNYNVGAASGSTHGAM